MKTITLLKEEINDQKNERKDVEKKLKNVEKQLKQTEKAKADLNHKVRNFTLIAYGRNTLLSYIFCYPVCFHICLYLTISFVMEALYS